MVIANGRTVARLGTALLGASIAASPAAACDTRHFYNHSDRPWFILLEGGATCSFGTVNKATKCWIPPGQTGDIHYPGFANGIFGGVLTAGPEGGTGPRYQYTDLCALKHDGNTGNVVLNDPADGDVQTCGHRTGGNYDCR